jgi:hypothetical protein
MLKTYFSDRSKRFQQLSALLVAVIVSAIGTYLLVGSHAATPYAAITADSGTLASGATKQSCSGASDGNCVVFGGGGVGGSNMMVGMNAGGWNTGNPGDADVASAGKYVRLDSANCPNPVTPTYPITGAEYTDCPAGSDIVQLAHDGAKVILDFSGPYNTGGVSALVGNGSGATTWANNALAWYKEYCGITNTECPAIEVLNEPDGWWFWGTGSSDTSTTDQTNANAYATLVHTTYQTFHNSLGSNAPSILATYDDSAWSTEWWNANSTTLGSSSGYVDGVVVHPYGGTNNSTKAAIAGSAAGSRQQVTNAHNSTGKPAYITEVGWPTDNSGSTVTSLNETGDSLQWPEADSSGNAYHGLDQCDNVYNFVTWARGTGYVNAVMIYGYISGTTNNAQYGLEFYNNSTGATRHKAGWYALMAAGHQQANPCPSASNNYAQPS